MSLVGNPEQVVAEVQAAIVATINALGTTLVGAGFEWLESSPIPDDEIAQILVGVTAHTERDQP